MTAILDGEVADLRRANAELQRRLEQARAERDENAAQKAAMAEILETINALPGDLGPVFDAILERALRLCDAAFGEMHSFDGQNLHTVALRNVPTALAEVLTAAPIRPDPEQSFLGRATCQGLTIHVADLRNEQPYVSGAPLAVASAELGGIRTLLHVPLLKDNAVLGVLTLFRQEVRPFSKAQIALLQSFAAHAVIAMENARLLTETREALEQQTATAEVLQVINSSPGDLAPVFDAMLDKAMRLCNAPLGLLLEFDGECFRAATLHGAPPAYVEFMLRGPIRPGPNTGLARLAATRRLVHIEDLAAETAYREGDPLRKASVDLAGMRTFLAVPLIKESALLGAFVIYRQEVQPFCAGAKNSWSMAGRKAGAPIPVIC